MCCRTNAYGATALFGRVGGRANDTDTTKRVRSAKKNSDTIIIKILNKKELKK
jgi:hypothetical protein